MRESCCLNTENVFPETFEIFFALPPFLHNLTVNFGTNNKILLSKRASIVTSFTINKTFTDPKIYFCHVLDSLPPEISVQFPTLLQRSKASENGEKILVSARDLSWDYQFYHNGTRCSKTVEKFWLVG